jgi:hypothetical protein
MDPVTPTPVSPNTPTIASPMPPLASVATPGRLVAQDRRTVGITSDMLTPLLAALSEAGIRHVSVVVEVAGQRLVVDATINRRVDRRNGRAYFWLYPLGTGQTLLRDVYLKHRAGAPRGAKNPLPVVIYSVFPKSK